MILELDDELEYLHDHNIFLHDRTESVFKLRNIKNQCVDLFSSLIECFGDLAVQSILQIIRSLLGQKALLQEPPSQAKPGQGDQKQGEGVEAGVDFSLIEQGKE